MSNDFFQISLKAARVNANLSLKDAAKHLHISDKTLSNYEKGKTVPTWDKVQAMERLYQINIDHIFFKSGSALSGKTEASRHEASS